MRSKFKLVQEFVATIPKQRKSKRQWQCSGLYSFTVHNY